MGKQELIALIDKMEETNPGYLDEQIAAHDHEYAMQKAAGIQFFKEEDLPKISKLIDLLIEIRDERNKE